METTKNQLRLYPDVNSLMSQAEAESQKSEANFVESTKLYFIARYFVAVYESRNHEIPIQVWNEYRNALDHYFRWQTSGADTDSNHLSKMQRHLLRACLDILKIFVHKTLTTATEWRNSYDRKVLELVDNGEFFYRIVALEREIGQFYETAKVLDAGLGDDDDENGHILNKYLEAAFMADTLLLELIDRQKDFLQAEKTLNQIHTAAHNLSIREHFKVHFWFYIMWTLATAVLSAGSTYFISEYKAEIKQGKEEVIGLFASKPIVESGNGLNQEKQNETLDVLEK